tara:strand:+ start:643 stop:993 length:351 start_codon:yes stop_codon:yes gene_type:complete
MVNIHYSFLKSKEDQEIYADLLEDISFLNDRVALILEGKGKDYVKQYHNLSYKVKEKVFKAYQALVSHTLWSAVENVGEDYNIKSRLFDDFINGDHIDLSDYTFDALEDEFYCYLN